MPIRWKTIVVASVLAATTSVRAQDPPARPDLSEAKRLETEAVARLSAGDVLAAEQAVTEALGLLERAVGPNDPAIAPALLVLADVRDAQFGPTPGWGLRVLVLGLRERAEEMCRGEDVPPEISIGVHRSLARSYRGLHNDIGAAEHELKAFDVGASAQRPDLDTLCEALRCGLRAFTVNTERDSATPVDWERRWGCAGRAMRLVSMCETSEGQSSPRTGVALVLFAECLVGEEKRTTDVERALERALPIAAGSPELIREVRVCLSDHAWSTRDLEGFETHLRASGVEWRDAGGTQVPVPSGRWADTWARRWLANAKDLETARAEKNGQKTKPAAEEVFSKTRTVARLRRARSTFADSQSNASHHQANVDDYYLSHLHKYVAALEGGPYLVQSEALLRELLASLDKVRSKAAYVRNHAQALGLLGRILANQGKTDDAIAAFEQAVRMLGGVQRATDPDVITNVAMICRLAERSGDVERVHAILDQFVEDLRPQPSIGMQFMVPVQVRWPKSAGFAPIGMDDVWASIQCVLELCQRTGRRRDERFLTELSSISLESYAVEQLRGGLPRQAVWGARSGFERRWRTRVGSDAKQGTAETSMDAATMVAWAELIASLRAAGAFEEALALLADFTGASGVTGNVRVAGELATDTILRSWAQAATPRQALLLTLYGDLSVADTLARRGNFEQAMPFAREAQAIGDRFDEFVGETAATPSRSRPFTGDPALETFLGCDPFDLAAEATRASARILAGIGDPDGAIRVLVEAVATARRRTSPSHVSVGAALVALAEVEMAAGRVAEARLHAAAGLTVLEPALGPRHADLAVALLATADADLLSGEPQDARSRYERALSVLKDSVFECHPDVARANAGIALCLARSGEAKAALGPMREALRLVALRIGLTYSGATAVERIGIVASAHWALADWVEVARAAGVDGYAEVLWLKSYVGLRMAGEERALRALLPAKSAAVDELRSAQRRLASSVIDRPGRGWRRVPWLREIAELASRVEDLRASLLAGSTRPSVSADDWTRTAQRIALGLEDGEALVDTLRVGERYAAWVVRRGHPIVQVDLGPAQEVESAIESFRDATRDAKTVSDAEFRKAGFAASKRVWQPFARAVGSGVSTLYFVPDAAFCAMPFDALPSSDGRGILADEVLIVRLAAAQDVLSPAPASGERRGMGVLTVGGVDYENGVRVSGREVTAARPLRERVSGWPRFVALPGTAREADAVARAFRAAGGFDRSLRGMDATESALRYAVRTVRVVHFATHGYVRESLNASLRLPDRPEFRLGPGLERHVQCLDPMLISGLALSGANTRVEEGEDDGILSAAEAIELDLDGNDLVVLSACETARGVECAGDGVLGLVKGFTVAGARHVVASLWPVGDDATVALMERFYAHYLAGDVAPADALRAANRALREGTAGATASAPRHWAAFVAHGPLR